MIDLKINKDVCITNLTVVSKERLCKNGADHMQNGRCFDGFLFIHEGEAVFNLGSKTYKAEHDELVYIPYGSRYKMQYVANKNVFTLVDCRLLDGDGNAVRLFEEITVLRSIADKRIKSVIEELRFYANDAGSLGYFKRKELVFNLLGIIFDNASSHDSNDRMYTQLLKGEELLKRTYLSSLPVIEYAKASNLSESGFRALFFRKYGMSPIKYRNLLRINRAVALLNKGEYSVKEVCFECGFENIGYFCRYYKKIIGETPQETKNKISKFN